MQFQATESWWPFWVARLARSTLSDFSLSAASSPHIFGQLVCGLTESDALLTIITTLKKACMPSQSLRLVTGNDVHGNTEL
jgi:hypothetical protein